MNVSEIIEASKRNAYISGTYVITKIELKTFLRKPGNFLSCELLDKTGSVKGVIWDNAEKFAASLTGKGVVEITGEATRYNDSPQVVIKTIKGVTEYDQSDFLPSLDYTELASLKIDLKTFHMSIRDATCAGYWSSICGKPIYDAFCECPGGVGTVHHNYLGGLLEHTVSMLRIADQVCNTILLKTPINRDILLTGCLYHDIGKIQSYNWSKAIEMNDSGRLLHHTSLGYGMFRDINRELGVDENDITYLKIAHIIVSHHEDQGHVDAMFPEAQLVSQIDALDAMVRHSSDFILNNKTAGNNWTPFCKLTDTFYYCPEKD